MSRTPSVTMLPYVQDAIRVHAQGKGDSDGQSRRFSVDPQLTNFDILRNIIGRAFDLNGDFNISYRAIDDFGGETFLPMVSDWDLSAAFLSASDPDLQLMIEPKIKINYGDGPADEDAWELIRSTEVIPPSPLPSKLNNNKRNTGPTNNGQPAVETNGATTVSQGYPINFNPRINTTGLFNTMERWVQKAKTFVEDISVVTTRPPLSDVEFRHYLDAAGILCRPKELRFACYHGGIEPSLRKVVWKHLLNVYPDGLTGNGRMEYIRNKAKDYYDLRDVWKNAIQNGLVNEEIMAVSNMVRKDVLRTDRHLKFFAGQDDNQNIGILFNILTTYALNHPSVGYCQGMSDLASPLLVTMGDEAQAYICFCSLMDRIKPNFNSDGLAMSMKFDHLSKAMAYYDNTFWRYLKSMGADDLLFCYRWLLLEMKREFAFDDALRMMEVLWASLPYKPQDVPLYEVQFTGLNSQSCPIPVPSLTSSFSKVCAIRRSSTASSSLDLRRRRISARRPKATPHLSLDENSLTSLSSTETSSHRSHTKPFYSMDETMEILESREFLNHSPFEILSLKDAPPPEPSKPAKLVKNLKEFWQISNNKRNMGSGDDSIHSSNSSTLSNRDGHTDGHALFEISHQSVFSDDEDGDDRDLSHTPKPEHYVFPNNCTSTVSSSNNMNLHRSVSLNNNETGAGQQNGAIQSSGILQCGNVQEPTGQPAGSSSMLPSGNTLVLPEPGAECCVDSENDSGNCCSESYEMDENSLEEPEFQDKCRPPNKLPSPTEFGGGNPFLMFLCLTLLLQHRDHILRNQLDYNETAMYFDKMVRKHNVARVLAHARQMYSNYLKQAVPRV